MILAADVGGTKTCLAFFEQPRLESKTWSEEVKNNDFEDIYELITDVVPDQLRFEILILGIAGPLIDGEVEMTNLDWTISQHELKSRFGLKYVRILNDLEALAYYIPYLSEKERTLIKSGVVKDLNSLLVVAVGTGLGKAVIVRSGSSYKVIKTEGGHTGFSPHSELDIEIHRYLLNKYEHVSNEMLCSSIGFKNLCRYYLDENPKVFSDELRDALENSSDQARTIIEFDKEKPLSGARTIIQQVVRYIAAYIGDQGLSLLPDAIYIGGGIGLALDKYLKLVEFQEEMTKKGKMRSAIRDIPIYLINKNDAPVLGAALCGFEAAINLQTTGT